MGNLSQSVFDPVQYTPVWPVPMSTQNAQRIKFNQGDLIIRIVEVDQRIKPCSRYMNFMEFTRASGPMVCVLPTDGSCTANCWPAKQQCTTSTTRHHWVFVQAGANLAAEKNPRIDHDSVPKTRKTAGTHDNIISSSWDNRRWTTCLSPCGCQHTVHRVQKYETRHIQLRTFKRVIRVSFALDINYLPVRLSSALDVSSPWKNNAERVPWSRSIKGISRALSMCVAEFDQWRSVGLWVCQMYAMHTLQVSLHSIIWLHSHTRSRPVCHFTTCSVGPAYQSHRIKIEYPCFQNFDSVQFSSFSFIFKSDWVPDPQMPVPYSPPSMEGYTWTPSHESRLRLFDRKGLDHLV